MGARRSTTRQDQLPEAGSLLGMTTDALSGMPVANLIVATVEPDPRQSNPDRSTPGRNGAPRAKATQGRFALHNFHALRSSLTAIERSLSPIVLLHRR